MPWRWVYPWTWQSVLPDSWLVVSVDGFIRFPRRWWWGIPVLVHGKLGHRELLLCVSGRLDGGGNSGVGRDWCGWVSGTLCALGSHPSFCICTYPGMEGGLLLLLPWWIVYCCVAHWGSSGILLVFLVHGARWRRCRLHICTSVQACVWLVL